MIVLDGAEGEGGGQIVRSALSLSAITGEPVRVHNVRGQRKKPGLMRQHLTALLAMAEVCNGRADGAHVGSSEFVFFPGSLRAGDYQFSVGTAGSANLVLQTVLPALLRADGASTVIVAGGTHNSAAPPFEFLVESYLPVLQQLGHQVSARIERYGFYPAGGGEISITIDPARESRELVMVDRGVEIERSVDAIISNLAGSIAERELATSGTMLDVPESHRRIVTRHSPGPGNVLLARFRYEHLTAVFAQFGERGVSAEQVAKRLAKMAITFTSSNAAVTGHLADQVLLPMALSGGGSFSTLKPSLHARTNAEVITRFLGHDIRFHADATKSSFRCEVKL